MSQILVPIRRLAVVGTVLALAVVPVGVYWLFSAVSPDLGDNGLGDAIGGWVGVVLVGLGGGGALLSFVLWTIANRAAADPIALHWPRLVQLGLAVALGEVIVAIALGAGWIAVVAPGAALAAGFVIVGAASRTRSNRVAAALASVGLLGAGAILLGAEAIAGVAFASRDARVALLPRDWSAAIEGAASAGPQGWHVALIDAEVTDFSAAGEIRALPAGMAASPLRGVVVADCAGSVQLEIVATLAEGSLALATAPCLREPRVVSIDVPDGAITRGTANVVGAIEARAIDVGRGGAMTRTLVLVAPADTPDPDSDAILAAFVAAFGSESPR